MTDATPPLSPRLTDAVLQYLRVPRRAPSLTALDQLVYAYVRNVPWESAFRIVKRAQSPDTPLRLPDEFWQDAIERGGGGTCFESNYAFFSLLTALGYRGYLTINNMNENIGCHTAMMIEVDQQRWLVDVGLPLHVPIPIQATTTQRASKFHDYTLTPERKDYYIVTKSHTPTPYAFTFIDQPVSNTDYLAASAADYGENGLFLDRVIINKIIEDRQWRFRSDQPDKLQSYDKNETRDYPIKGDTAETLAEHFSMDAATLRAALALVPPPTNDADA